MRRLFSRILPKRMHRSLLSKVFFVFVLLVCGQAYCQTSLRIGDRIPDVSLGNVIRHSSPTLKFPDYSGKLLVLDFWATWCNPCISLFPKTDSLQKVFKGEVQFVAVTYEPKEKAEKLFNKLSKLKNVQIPIITEDVLLHQLFPHRELPHYVWIDKTGMVVAITEAEAVNAATIRKMLAVPVALATKEDVTIPFSKNKPLLIGGNGGGGEALKYHRMVTGYIEGVPGGYHIFKADSLYGGRIQATNVPLPWLWQLAYSNGAKVFGYSQTIFEVADVTSLRTSSSGEKYEAWLKAGHGYGYEIVVPKGFEGSLYQLMQEDLALNFPQYKVNIETRKRPCLALVRTSDADKLKSRGGKPSFAFDATGGELKNWPLRILVKQLNAKYLQHLSTPVVDLTQYTGATDLTIHADMSNVEAIRRSLQPYDLDLIASECDVEVIVIRDNPLYK